MQDHALFYTLSLRDVVPRGWLRSELQKQHKGLTGNLHLAGYPFDTRGFAGPRIRMRAGQAWWPYEQYAYWVDGLARCGYLLRDHAAMQKAEHQLRHVVEHPDRKGYLGPRHLKDESIHQARWVHAVLFRALMAYHDYRGGAVPKAVARHYLSDTCSHSTWRDVCNVESMLWAYGQTRDRRLLHRALRAYGEYNERFPDSPAGLKQLRARTKPYEHGVTYCEKLKLPALLYRFTGNPDLLRATENGFAKLDRYHMLIDGVPSSTEFLSGRSPLDGHETCDIADYTWSASALMLITGDARYADRVERAVFNAFPGAVKDDFKALQYFSAPNQVIADRRSNYFEESFGQPFCSYRPKPGTECCTAQVTRILPNYVARMWAQTATGGLAALLYGPSRVRARLGRSGTAAAVEQVTRYPFGEQVCFRFKMASPTTFPFHLRIPGWCSRARVELNGHDLALDTHAGSLVTIKRRFEDRDELVLHLPMRLKRIRWPEGGVAIERGPLLFALQIEEDWQVDEGAEHATGEFPAWNLYAASPWNYALDVPRRGWQRLVKEQTNRYSNDPWRANSPPLELHLPARKVSGWRLRTPGSGWRQAWSDTRGTYRERVYDDFAFTPRLPTPAALARGLSKQTEIIRLVPYGCTHLRLTLFPSTA